MLSLRDKIEIVLLCGENRTNRDVQRIFNARHPERSIAHSSVSRIINKFKRTGSVENLFKRQHVAWKNNQETSLQVCLDVVEQQITSVSQISHRCEISDTSARRILKNNRFHPYKPRFISTLNERDFIPRFDFSVWFQGEIEENPLFPRQILWTDESTFTSNGVVSSQNCRWWAQENPNFIIECKDQYSFKVNVWCGILDNKLIGPFFFRENLNSEKYLHFLNNKIFDVLNRMPLNLRQNMWYQQDGASIHSTVAVRNFLDQKFQRKWIGRYSQYPWPARSPDLTPLDFFLWGYLKYKVYKKRPFRNLDHLEHTIRECAFQIPPEFLKNAVKDVSRRTEICIERDGHHSEM